MELLVYRVVMHWSNIPPTSRVQTDNSTLQMLFNTTNRMNQRLNKLDMLDDLCARRSNMEKHFNKRDNDILDIRNDWRQQSQRNSDEEFHYNIVETRVSAIESDKDQLQWESIELREKRLKMQTHSMKYNLIFSGIHE